jgi:adiponectin receptor
MQRDHITTGYTGPRSTLGEVWVTCFEVQNQTINIWSHVVGTLYSLAMGSSVLSRGWSEHAWFTPLIIGSTSMFALSAGYHALSIMGKESFWRWLGFDYLGIVLQIWGGWVSMMASVLHCQPARLHVYVFVHLLATLYIAAGVLRLAKSSKGGLEQVVWFAVYFVMNVSLVVGHLLHNGSPDAALASTVLHKLAVFFVTQLVGVLFYATKFPEKRFPGKFNLLGNSHQIFHVLVVVGIYAFYDAATFTHEHRELISIPYGASSCGV